MVRVGKAGKRAKAEAIIAAGRADAVAKVAKAALLLADTRRWMVLRQQAQASARMVKSADAAVAVVGPGGLAAQATARAQKVRQHRLARHRCQISNNAVTEHAALMSVA